MSYPIPQEKTGKNLAEYAKSLLSNQANTWYMYGNNGKLITEAYIQIKAAQYPTRYTDSHIAELRKHIGSWGYDCSSFTDLFTGMDKSANGWLEAATVKGTIDTIPDMPGLSVHYPGHMGIYIGNGEVVEARGTWWGIVKTKLSQRGWKNWAKVPTVDYSTGDDDLIYCKYGDGRQTATSSDISVKTMQAGLAELGYTITADGRYGGGTVTVVKTFLSDNGVVSNGEIFDKKACDILFDKLTKRADSMEQSYNTAQTALISTKVQLADANNKIANAQAALA